MLWIWLLAIPGLLDAQESEQWQVTDLEFMSKKVPEAPFEVEFGARFIHEGGRTMKVPGFYNGGKTYVLRFCPPDTGIWNYITHASLPELSGESGSLQVTSSSKADEHGPLIISDSDPRKLSYADGSPYFMLAFELDWLFALDADNPDDIPRTRQLITSVKAKGFNKVVMNVFANDASWPKPADIAPEHDFSNPQVFPFGGRNNYPDFSTLNVEFFKRLDRVMAHLDEQEIISHLMIYVWNKKVSWPEPSSLADNRYFDYVVKRYQAFPNLFWDISKEALGYGRNDMGYITERIDRLRRLDGHRRLLTVHDYAYCNRHPDKVDIMAIQNWSPDLYNNTRNVLEKHPGKVVFNIEHGGYEYSLHSIFDGAYNEAVSCLERNYDIVFAGAYSTYYWQHTSWYEVVWNPDALPPDQQPQWTYYKHLQELFTRYPFQELRPIRAGTHGLVKGKDTYLFYLTRGMIALTGSSGELRDKHVNLTWFDPLSGAYHDQGSMKLGQWMGIRKPEEIQSPFCILILETKD